MYSKANLRQVIKPEVLVVGIDVAKRHHVATIRLPDGTKKKAFSFSNDRVGFDRLLARAESVRANCGCTSILFGIESSGHYGHALKHFLTWNGYAAVGINPSHTKRVKELEDNSPEKNDAKDSGIISDLGAQGRGRPLMIPRGVYADLRGLGKFRERLSVERTRIMNRYKALVDLVFPELNSIIGDVASISIRRLMAQYPSAAEVARLEFEELRRLLRRWSIGHLHHEQCHRIHRAAKESVGITEGLYAARLEMRQTLEALQIVEGRIREVEAAQEQALLRVPYAEHLLSIPQLGVVTGATILGETGDLRQYRNADAVIKLAGLNLYTKSSGIFKGKTRITKRGRPLLRQYLYLAALRLSKRGQPLTDFHDRLLPAKARPQIAVALCRKLVRLMVAVVRDEVDYEVGRLAVDPTLRETVSAGGRTLANTG
jgi:transposase